MSPHGDYPQGGGFSSNGDPAGSPNKSQNNSWLTLEVYVKANQPDLLKGLDKWLELNLITQAQVRKISRKYLSCNLPEIEVVKATKNVQKNISKTVTITDISLPQVASKSNLISQLWQGFLDELSIRWLLFLGIFLVIISSGVLVASQWDNFPRFGQYLILLIYTLGFWGIGLWSSKQENLKLTSQTLSAIATLLVPINFWAISRFNLGNNILEWITIIIALIALTTSIYWQSLFKQQEINRLFFPLFLFLSYLHLGWQFSNFSLVAIYVGIVAISIIYSKFLLPQEQYSLPNLLFLLAAWSLLLFRGILTRLTEQNLIYDHGLAIALWGWLLGTIYLNQAKRQPGKEENATNNFFQLISIILLCLAWIISIWGGMLQSELFFWQTVGISALAIHLFSQKLTHNWRKRDLTAIFLIGLQTLYISKELIPDNFRTTALNLSIAISKTEYFPESVFSVTLFPYVILFIWIATWLYRRQQRELAIYGEFLTLILGILLTYLSLSNPTWRSLNLLLSTLTLGYVAWIRQPKRIELIYLTHLLGLITIMNGISVIFPNLNPGVWASILVCFMAGEWGIYIHYAKQPKINFKSNFIARIQESYWYFGLILGANAYICLLLQISANSNPTNFYWGLIWLITPGMLTLIAKYTHKIQQRRLATYLSCLTLIAAQLLVVVQPETRFIGLTFALGLMLANAFHLRRITVTVIHLGFILSLIASLLNTFINNWNWLIVGALTILGLYQFRQYLLQAIDTPKFSYISQRNAQGILGVGREEQNFKLIEKYIKAAEYWVIALITVEITLLSLIYPNLAQFDYYPQYLLTTVLIFGAIIWRYGKQPSNHVLFSLVWLGELLTAGIILPLGGNNLTLAIANIILGLLALGLIGWLAIKFPVWDELNLLSISLIYGGLGIIWRIPYFNAYTGLLTLGVAMILINTKQNNKNTGLVINYLAFAGITLGIYEIVIYQMQQSSGESIADGITILALVAAAIAFIYRLGAWLYRQRHQTTLLNLSLPRVILIAHFHWAVSSILKIIAASIAIESATSRLTPLSIATSFCLGAYALIQGKDKDSEDTPSNNNDWWVYVGLVEIAATLVYSRLIITQLSLFDPWRVIFTCAVALAIYQIPWRNLGWRATPWQRTALITPALMALVTAEDISYLSLIVTAIFYLRIAYYQKNIRWSYISLGFINWGVIRIVWQYNTEFIWLAGIISLSILYIAQFDPYLKSHRQQRHYLRLAGSSIICIAALFYQDLGIIPSVISFSLIFLGLGLKIRAFLFTGTITLIVTAIYQLIILVLTYSFLKWILGLLAGICSIVIAASFEKQRDLLNYHVQNYGGKLKNWQ